MIENCLACQNSNLCTRCNSPALYPDKNACVKCSDKFTACVECSFEDNCVKCESNKYYADKGSCHLCA
jgi:hypothetical protein